MVPDGKQGDKSQFRRSLEGFGGRVLVCSKRQSKKERERKEGRERQQVGMETRRRYVSQKTKKTRYAGAESDGRFDTIKSEGQIRFV